MQSIYRHIHRGFVVLAVLSAALSASAQSSLSSDSAFTQQAMELRARVTFTKSLPKGFSLSLRQDFRARMLENTRAAMAADAPVFHEQPYIRRLYTTFTVGYQPIEYLSIKGSYVLRVLGDKWHREPQDYLRHRAIVVLTGQYRYRSWKFALCEQLDVDCRTDSVNPLESRKVELTLRHILQADYSFAGSPWQLKTKLELHNTLNQPTAYLNSCVPDGHYGQYLSSVRAEIGVRWKLSDMHALTLSYCYRWDYSRDMEISSLDASLALSRTTSHTHIIQLAYELGW